MVSLDGYGILILHLAPTASWGGADSGENQTLIPVMAGDGDLYALLPC
jgi:hypothetical protein